MNPELTKTLWDAADKLRSNMDAAEYKHIVLGLIFLKYVSDSFVERRREVACMVAEPASDYYIGDDPQDQKEALEERDYYTSANIFWVPAAARWETIRDQAKQPDIGRIIDDALIAIEQENPRLKGILDKRFARAQLEPGKLGELIDMISKIGFGGRDKAKDLLGEVYEYFLGQFASAEGKKGGQFYTPASVVRVLVEVLSPHKGKIYDPCCGSGGMFVQSEKFIESHGGKFGDASIYGQESNPTTWRLVAMNLAIRGMDFNLGKEPADTFTRDQHPDLKADYVMANPPFNISDWWNEKLAGDKRWAYGTPPAGNANFAWLQHIIWHLKPAGSAGVVLANGSMSSNTNNEGTIRQAMVEGDVVECMVALPPQLFFNTQIPACLWFLNRDKSGSPSPGLRPPSPSGRGDSLSFSPGEKVPARADEGGLRDRRGEVLFIDARKLGRMANRTLRVFDDEHIARIADAVHLWRTSPKILPPLQGEGRGGDGVDSRSSTSTCNQPHPHPNLPPEGEGTNGLKFYEDIPGFCRSVKLDEIREHGFVLTPGRYVGAEDVEDDDEAFNEKMDRLTSLLAAQMAKGAELDEVIRQKLGGLGYGV